MVIFTSMSLYAQGLSPSTGDCLSPIAFGEGINIVSLGVDPRHCKSPDPRLATMRTEVSQFVFLFAVETSVEWSFPSNTFLM